MSDTGNQDHLRKNAHKPSESAVIDQIEQEERAKATDDQYEQERPPEEPLIVTGASKKGWLKRIVTSKNFWLSFVGLVVLAVLFAWLITPSRLWIVNILGLKAQLSVTTMAAAEGAPPALKNVTVVVNGHEYHTNDEGRLQIEVPYGQTKVVISKQGYEGATRDILLDFDPFFYYLGGKQADKDARNIQAMLKSVGIPVTFTAKDWFTGLPIIHAKFIVGDIITEPKEDGAVTMTVPATDAKTVPMRATFASNYAETVVELKMVSEPQEFVFVPAGKNYFVSKRSGQLAVYASNLDGSEVTQVVPGSPNETGDIAFTVSPDGRYGVLASTRETARDPFGSLQQKLYIVDLSTNTLRAVDTALGFTFADWSDGRLVYTARFTQNGSSVRRLASADPASGAVTNLATHSSFTVVRASLGSAVYVNGTKELRTVKIKGGTDKMLGANVTRLAQADAARFVYQIAGSSWHYYDVNTDQVGNTTTPASVHRAFLAASSADNQLKLVFDTLDGTQTLIARRIADGHETRLYAGHNLRGPVRWVGNVAVYRAGPADYAVSPYGGQPKKIADVEPGTNHSNDYFTFN